MSREDLGQVFLICSSMWTLSIKGRNVILKQVHRSFLVFLLLGPVVLFLFYFTKVSIDHILNLSRASQSVHTS